MSYFGTDATLDKGKPIFLYEFFGTGVGTWYFNNGVGPFVFAGNVYNPWPVKHSDVSVNMTGDRSDLKVTLAAGSSLDPIYTDYPPSGVLNVIVRRTHEDMEAGAADCPVTWQGRVLGVEFTSTSEVEMTCQPTHAGSRRPGLRRNYQLLCPLLLYGVDCRASKPRATITRTVTAVGPNSITISSVGVSEDALIASRLRGGTIQWSTGGQLRIYPIRSVTGNNLVVNIPQTVKQLAVGGTVTLVYGCNRTMDDCRNVHDNILNYGGQPFIPTENPATTSTSIFY